MPDSVRADTAPPQTEPTPGPWFVRQWDGDQWPEKRWSVGPNTGAMPEAVCISPRLPGDRDAANARLIAAACTSYDKHCGPRAVECAEADLLGQLVEGLEDEAAWNANEARICDGQAEGSRGVTREWAKSAAHTHRKAEARLRALLSKLPKEGR